LRAHYTPARVARKLKAMLEQPRFALRAQSVALKVNRENGVRSACDALEALYRRARKPS
jgi:UDP:flavonoid glycosyltransferase YjiC (YdhE family)